MNKMVCAVAPTSQWIRGSFNVCIPIEVQSPNACRKLLLRCAMPYKLGGTKNPGSIDEKMSCEVGTYAWIQDRCPDIRIPYLYGFGFFDHRQFTHEASRSWYIRVMRWARRQLHSLLANPNLLSLYTSHPSNHHLPTAYMLLEHVGSDTSQMLSNTFHQQRGDLDRRRRLFRGIARIILSLAGIPQPRIGAFRFHNDSSITLTNRPPHCAIMILENDGTPRTMSINETYSCTEPFVADMLAFHDRRFLSHPNAIYDDKDCRGEMAAKVMLRALPHQYIRQSDRNGPFFLQLSDLHPSNIFVDDQWNITCLIDLEWVCALPREMLAAPHWLTGRAIDGVRKGLSEFSAVHAEFLEAFEDEERTANAGKSTSLTSSIRESWESGGVWFWHSIMSTNAMYPLFTYHIRPRFLSERLLFREEGLLSKFWSEDAEKVVESKVQEHEWYKGELTRLVNIT
ncbi:hypothetical protein EV126DRAFT_416972 [Verticillium dahliae]|nr:hypothetical protein EV126DRAFT_416972 [Verticillium dahliae]